MTPFTWRWVRQALPLGLLLMLLVSVSATTFAVGKWLQARQELRAIREAIGNPETLSCLRGDNRGSAATGPARQDKAAGHAAQERPPGAEEAVPATPANPADPSGDASKRASTLLDEWLRRRK